LTKSTFREEYGRFAKRWPWEAEPLLKDGYNGMKLREKTIPPAVQPRLTEALKRLVQLYEATGNMEEAERWRKELAAHQAAQKQPKK
jgi:eukaryotic-like serine/threonine-protein kinase